MITTIVFMDLFLLAFSSNVQAWTIFNFDYATDTQSDSS